jgi:putative transposase
MWERLDIQGVGTTRMAKSRTSKRTPKESVRGGNRSLKKINFRVNELRSTNFFHGYYDKIRLMFTDEALFGRITNIRSCWCPEGVRPTVSSLKIREYIYAYGSVDPINGDSFFIVAGACNTAWTNLFLDELSKQFPNDYIVLCEDRASWHKSKDLVLPDNIELFFIPPATPEMNPMEQIWDELKEKDFDNRFFHTLNKVIDQLCISINNLYSHIVKSITGREWIISTF